VNPRQRRAILLLGLSALGLVGVFVLVANYVAGVRSQIEPKVTLLALSRDASPYLPVTDDMVREVVMPQRYAPPTAVSDRSTLVGLVPTTELTKGSILQEGMLAGSPDLEGGQRELAILVDAETGVAGKVRPGSIVDIIATFPGNEEGTVLARSRVVVPAARIIDVGQSQLKGGIEQENADPQEVVPVTFALSPRDALKVSYAEVNAQELRLGLQRPDETEKVLSERERVYAPREP